MRATWIVAAGGGALLFFLGTLCGRSATAKDGDAVRLPEVVAAFVHDTAAGGTFVLEATADGTVVNHEASVPLSAVPKALVEAADRHVLGGKAIAAEKEWIDGVTYWEVIKEVGGLPREILMKEDGSLAGLETVLRTDGAPKAVLEAAERAVGGDPVVVEKVTGPEAMGGTEYHVKRRVDGEVVRVSVSEDGKVGRIYRKISAEMRIPR